MKKVRKQRKYFKNRRSQRVNEHTIRAMIRFLSKKNNLPYASVSSYYSGKFVLLKGYGTINPKKFKLIVYLLAFIFAFKYVI